MKLKKNKELYEMLTLMGNIRKNRISKLKIPCRSHFDALPPFCFLIFTILMTLKKDQLVSINYYLIYSPILILILHSFYVIIVSFAWSDTYYPIYFNENKDKKYTGVREECLLSALVNYLTLPWLSVTNTLVSVRLIGGMMTISAIFLLLFMHDQFGLFSLLVPMVPLAVCSLGGSIYVLLYLGKTWIGWQKVLCLMLCLSLLSISLACIYIGLKTQGIVDWSWKTTFCPFYFMLITLHFSFAWISFRWSGFFIRIRTRPGLVQGFIVLFDINLMLVIFKLEGYALVPYIGAFFPVLLTELGFLIASLVHSYHMARADLYMD